jgi:hypothetical protein
VGWCGSGGGVVVVDI